MDSLSAQMRMGLNLADPGVTQSSEDWLANATPVEIDAFRRQLLIQQQVSNFDDVSLVQRFLKAAQKQQQKGADSKKPEEDCTFYNQIMLPVVVEKIEQLPADFAENWWCSACPQGTRALIFATYETTYVYDLEGSLICEHDSHLPGGSSAEVSKVSDPSECTILDCLFNDEQDTYYVVDVMCWAGNLLYQKETEFRLQYLSEKLKHIPTLAQVTQTNPFKFILLPMSKTCNRQSICNIITNAHFELTGLLFYHKSAFYSPGMTPFGCWLEAYLFEPVLNISTLQLKFPKNTHTRQQWKKNRYEGSQEQETRKSTQVRNSAHAYRNNNNARGRPVTGGGLQQYNPAYDYGYGGYGGYADYGGYIDYSGYALHGSYTYEYSYGNRGRRGGQRGGAHGVKTAQGNTEDAAETTESGQAQQSDKKKKKKGGAAKVMPSIPKPDDYPNWYEPHEVMMSVVMEKIPERFAEDWCCVVCPVAKRRTVVANEGWTCSYNKLLVMERKFQSVLPGGNLRFLQLIRNTDICILDCLHYKVDRTFFVLDLMFWKQMPYYDTEAEFRFNWIDMKLSECEAETISLNNEYKIKSMPRVQCLPGKIKAALEQATFKVDGLLFFQKSGTYQVGISPNVLWLEPKNIESILGFKPPDQIFAASNKASAPPTTGAAATATAGGASGAAGDAIPVVSGVLT